MFWNKTITLYNKYEDKDSGTIKWYRHKLEGCFYKVTNNKVNVGNVQMTTDDNIIRIPEQMNYLPPYKWIKLTEKDRQEKFILFFRICRHFICSWNTLEKSYCRCRIQ